MMLDTFQGCPRRVLDEGTQAVILPLLYGRARILVGPKDEDGGEVEYG